MSCPCYFIEEAEFKKLTQVDQNVPFSELRLAFDTAHRQTLYKLIGTDCRDELCAAIAASKEDPPTPLPAEWVALLEAIKYAAAYTIAYEHLNTLPTQRIVPQGLGLSGAQGIYGFEQATVEDNAKKISGFKAKAEFEIDEFRKWLEANKADYACLPTPPKCPTTSTGFGMYGTARYSPKIMGCGCKRR